MTVTTKNAPARSGNSGEGQSTNPAQFNAQETDMSIISETTENTNDLDVDIPQIDRPCPLWCELQDGHGWDSTWADHTRVSRFHQRYISPSQATAATVSITCEETAAIKDCGHPKPTYERREDGTLNRIACDCPLEADGPSEFSALAVSHDINEDLGAEEALEVGKWLQEAAVLVQSLQDGCPSWCTHHTRPFVVKPEDDKLTHHGQVTAGEIVVEISMGEDDLDGAVVWLPEVDWANGTNLDDVIAALSRAAALVRAVDLAETGASNV